MHGKSCFIGDEISAYDESGRLIGSTSFNGENIALTLWGDDLITSNKDGLAVGEKLHLNYGILIQTQSLISSDKVGCREVMYIQ